MPPTDTSAEGNVNWHKWLVSATTGNIHMNIRRTRDFVSSTAPDFLGANEIMIDELFQKHTAKNTATQKHIEEIANKYKVGQGKRELNITFQGKVKMCTDQELMQSEPKSEAFQ